MRSRRDALTLTELLTVVSVIAILASMISPVVVRVRQEAVGHACISNLRQVYMATRLYANNNNGMLPNCFDYDKNADAPYETSWWYRKVGMMLYPLDNPYSYTRVCTIANCGLLWPATARTCPAPGRYDPATSQYIHPDKDGPLLDKDYPEWRPERCIGRCPASRDNPNQVTASAAVPKVDGGDKDRVFDDSYGYNNSGCTSGSNSYGFTYTNASPSPAVDPDTYRPPYYAVSKYYRTSWPGASGGVYSGSQGYNPTKIPTGRFTTGYGKSCPLCGRFWFDQTTVKCTADGSDTANVQLGSVGSWADIRGAASTILIMDYAKADASPLVIGGGGVDEGTVSEYNRTTKLTVPTITNGYAFRHGGKANVVFAAGNIQGFMRPSFFATVRTPKAHWEVLH